MSAPLHDEGPLPPELSADDAAFRAQFSQLVDYYRVSQAHVLWRAFWPGALVLLPLGCMLTAASMVERFVPASSRHVVATLGLVVTALGPGFCIVSLLRAIRRDDLYVALRTDGLVLKLARGGMPEVLPWDAIRDVRFDATLQAIVVTCAEHSVRIEARFADVSLEALAQKVRDARRLAVWQRLSPRFRLD